ncbi:MAG: YkgJ family cysteine cluster protein [Verrucomicrobiae bacterium]|nr:YkgJ family cysteine cluster protein [Verrucomicrobiae bacterium]
MKTFHIEAPQFQNWTCQGCGECCRGYHLVVISAEEKQRIESQRWTKADGVDPDRMILPHGAKFRLGHKPTGECVFLDAESRCLIHARFGEQAKPLACRVYPYAIHPAGEKLVVSLRFSCPAAAANIGEPLATQLRTLQQLARLIVPGDFKTVPPPPVLDKARLTWPDFFRFVTRLDKTLADTDAPLPLRVLRALDWLGAVERAKFDQITGSDADEVLGALVRRAGQKLPRMPEASERPSAFGRLLFRTLVFQYARRDTLKDLETPLRHRREMFNAVLKFALGSGAVPAFRPGLPKAVFSAVEKPWGQVTPEIEAMLTRFFRVKIRGLHFCGPAYFNWPLVDGFRALCLLLPVTMWIARWLAAGETADKLSAAHVARALSIVDHHHGYTDQLGSGAARRRVRLLTQRDDIAKLCVWYWR